MIHLLGVNEGTIKTKVPTSVGASYSMETTNRIAWIDVIKGLMLFFICVSHYGDYPPAITPLIAPTATYWVPCFIILSGYLYDRHRAASFHEHLARKSHTLLLPYLCFALLFVLLDWNNFVRPNLLPANLYRGFVDGFGVNLAPPLWFVLALYITNVAAYWLIKLWNRPLALGIVIVLLSLVSLLFSVYNIKLPLLIHLLPATLIYFLGGIFVRKVVESEKLWGWKRDSLTLLTIGGGILGLFINLGDFHLCIVHSYPLCFLCPLSMTMALAMILTRLHLTHTDILSRILMHVARNGLIVLATHFFLFVIVNSAIHGLHIADTSWAAFLLKTVFIFGALYILVVPFLNTFAYKTMGKQKTNWKDNYKL